MSFYDEVKSLALHKEEWIGRVIESPTCEGLIVLEISSQTISEGVMSNVWLVSTATTKILVMVPIYV